MNVKLIIVSSIVITIVLVAVGYFFLATGEEPISNKPYHRLIETLTIDEAPEIERFEPIEKKDIPSAKRKFSDVESPEEKVRATDKNLHPED
ncbi:hypothetical protein KAW08_01360 [bacterium]|nr:hypothetical protein [bacterium]